MPAPGRTLAYTSPRPVSALPDHQVTRHNYFSILFVCIIKRNDKIYTAQAKTSDYQVNKFDNDYQKGKHRAVDLLIYPENAKYKIFMVKDKVTKEIDK